MIKTSLSLLTFFSIMVFSSSLNLKSICLQRPFPYTCLLADRTTDCSSSTSKLVCGLFDPSIVQCFAYPCGVTFSNLCEACLDTTIYKVQEGSCENLNINSGEIIIDAEYICTEADRNPFNVCSQEYGPVCGFEDDDTFHQFSNNCSACKNVDVINVKSGNCPGSSEASSGGTSIPNNSTLPF